MDSDILLSIGQIIIAFYAWYLAVSLSRTQRDVHDLWHEIQAVDRDLDNLKYQVGEIEKVATHLEKRALPEHGGGSESPTDNRPFNSFRD